MRKRIPDYIPSTSTDRSAGPHSVFLPLSTKEVVDLSQASVDDKLCASRLSRYVLVINDNHLISVMNFNEAKVN
jgi:hypothetical protein